MRSNEIFKTISVWLAQIKRGKPWKDSTSLTKICSIFTKKHNEVVQQHYTEKRKFLIAPLKSYYVLTIDVGITTGHKWNEKICITKADWLNRRFVMTYIFEDRVVMQVWTRGSMLSALCTELKLLGYTFSKQSNWGTVCQWDTSFTLLRSELVKHRTRS